MCMPREACGHGLVTRLSCTKSCCSKYLLNISPCDSTSGGLDYHDPIDDSSGTDPSTMNCSYSQTITIPAGSSAATGVVAIINDEIYEGDEDFFLDLSVAGDFETYGINEGSPVRATVTIQDNDGKINCFAMFTSQIQGHSAFSSSPSPYFMQSWQCSLTLLHTLFLREKTRCLSLEETKHSRSLSPLMWHLWTSQLLVSACYLSLVQCWYNSKSLLCNGNEISTSW